MKKGRKALLIVGIVFVVLVGGMAAGVFSGMRYVRNMKVYPVDLSKVADGRYAGSFARGRFSYSVEVVVKNHRIEAVKSTGAKQPTEGIAQMVFERIIQEQAVDVDTVAGASLTSKAAAKAVENALIEAR